MRIIAYLGYLILGSVALSFWGLNAAADWLVNSAVVGG